jgi:hypothetical protein
MQQLTKQLQLTEEHLDLMWAVTEKVRPLLGPSGRISVVLRAGHAAREIQAYCGVPAAARCQLSSWFYS